MEFHHRSIFGFNTAGASGAVVLNCTVSASGYHCTVSGTCTPPVTSTRRALTVSSSVAIGTQPTAQTGCSGSSVNFSAGASGASPTYNWRKRGSGWGNAWTFNDNGGVHFLASSSEIDTGGR